MPRQKRSQDKTDAEREREERARGEQVEKGGRENRELAKKRKEDWDKGDDDRRRGRPTT